MSIPAKPSLVISVLNIQVCRNIFLSDKFELLLKLEKHFKLTILVNMKVLKMFETLEQTNKLLFDKITIIILPNLNPLPRKIQILNSISLYLTPQKHIFIWMARNKKFFLMPFLALLMVVSKFNFVKKCFRRIYFNAVLNSNQIHLVYGDLPSCDVYMSTSVTDISTHEKLLGIIYSKMGARTFATTRSWDNITTYGLLCWEPEKFLSHSDYMTLNLLKLQNFKQKHLVQAVAPNYQYKFISENLNKQLGGSITIGYANLGKKNNPDDFQMLEWFIQDMANDFPEINFKIFLHPDRPRKVDFLIPNNVSIETCYFESTTLDFYYLKLRSLDILFCGGTSVMLDAAFCGIQTYLINFEIIKQPYLLSALRYHDTWPHTRDFIRLSEIDKVDSKEDVRFICNEALRGKVGEAKLKNVKKFTGDSTADLSEIVLNQLKNLSQ
jgi:hypothetical protein